MRQQPTLRIPLGVLALVLSLMAYGTVVARFLAPLIAGWPPLGQAPVYALLGVIWLPPLRRFMIWMETGRWR